MWLRDQTPEPFSADNVKDTAPPEHFINLSHVISKTRTAHGFAGFSRPNSISQSHAILHYLLVHDMPIPAR
jgi:hypothetical protein